MVAATKASTAQAGKVATHANMMRRKTPQRTSDARLLAPTPTTALVIVWVVDSGMPYAEAA